MCGFNLDHDIPVLSESVASALEFLDNENMKETRLFIRMMNNFFDYLNVRSPLAYQLKRKDSIAPYRKVTDEYFKVGIKHIPYHKHIIICT